MKEKEVVDFDRFDQSLESRKQKLEEGTDIMRYDENYHLKDRPDWIVNLYYEIDRYAMNLRPEVRKEYLPSYIKYSFSGILFAYIVIRKGETLRIWAKVPYQSLEAVPLFVRDYSTTMHRPGVIVFFDDQREFVANKSVMLDTAFGIIKKALEGIIGGKRRKTPLHTVVETKSVLGVGPAFEKPVAVPKTPAVNLVLGEDNYITLTFKIPKSDKKVLFEILEKIIYE